MQLAIASFPGSCVGSEATLHKSLGTRLYAAIFYPMDCLAPWQVVYSHTQLPAKGDYHIYYAMVFPAGLHGVAALITVPSTHRGTNGHCQPQTRGTDCTTATQVHLPGWLCQHAARFVFVRVCGVWGCVVWHCICVCLCVCAWHCVCHCHCICATVCVYVCVCLCGILPVQNLNLINYFSSNINPPLQPPQTNFKAQMNFAFLPSYRTMTYHLLDISPTSSNCQLQTPLKSYTMQTLLAIWVMLAQWTLRSHDSHTPENAAHCNNWWHVQIWAGLLQSSLMYTE